MSFGIALAGALFFAAAPGGAPPAPLLTLIVSGGLCWVIGNYLLIFAVRRAGMARPFCIINLTSVLSFLGGGALLGELGAASVSRVGAMVLGVAAVVAGSALVSLISSAASDDSNGRASDGGVRAGIAAAFAAPIFFAAFNVVVAHGINRSGLALGPAFLSFSPGILLGALLLALLREPDGSDAGSKDESGAGGRSGVHHWLRAPAGWHALALSQGLIWGVAMCCVMNGWLGTGLTLGVPVGQGIITLVSAVWGLAVFKEFEHLRNMRRAFIQFLAGASLTVAGIAVLVLA